MKKIFYAISIILLIFVLVDSCVARRDSDADQSAEQQATTNSDFEDEVYAEEPDEEFSEEEDDEELDAVSAADDESVADEPAVEVNGKAIYGLELPAARTDDSYPEAVTFEVTVDGERNYAVFYDTETYTPLWVAYPLAAHHMGTLKRPSGWDYNPQLSTSDQVNLCSHSYNDDYSRGHLIPNASRNGNREMQVQTFYVTNSVPQIQNKFNGGIWQRLESALQGIAQQETIYIVTGVAFQKQGESCEVRYTTAKDDTKRVPVPNYFYKVVLRVERDSSGEVVDAEAIGFWFEHRAYSDKYYNYAMSVDEVERLTGFDFFASLPDDVEARAERNTKNFLR